MNLFKVKDMIAELQKYDPELQVIIYACGNGAQDIQRVIHNPAYNNGYFQVPEMISIEGDEYHG